ncbi:hypothetical protein EYF80_010972 [Liparis tanakae]|uniref:Uncharacterized protein n=1 Tax=Liparis tanakae TaxID=230148 RepID=A0A4Z2INJ7_9TELE|nr:hypothetical protein EYF80_010972 [Liparis tanakae]
MAAFLPAIQIGKVTARTQPYFSLSRSMSSARLSRYTSTRAFSLVSWSTWRLSSRISSSYRSPTRDVPLPRSCSSSASRILFCCSRKRTLSM